MKTLKDLKPVPYCNAVLHLQNVVLESKEVKVKRVQVPSIAGIRFKDINETKVVLLSEVMDTIVDGEINDLMQQELPQSVRTPRRAVRITIETL